jgi:hypothetical protein
MCQTSPQLDAASMTTHTPQPKPARPGQGAHLSKNSRVRLFWVRTVRGVTMRPSTNITAAVIRPMVMV